MKNNFTRLKFNPEIINKDILDWTSTETFKYILLDAPCSATGTIRKHPDLIFLKNKNELGKYIKAQQALLEKALSLLSTQGQLIYCVCSVQKNEGD
jgi:16S rRNA (cytosine967-C5)-methyltransferase